MPESCFTNWGGTLDLLAEDTLLAFDLLEFLRTGAYFYWAAVLALFFIAGLAYFI